MSQASGAGGPTTIRDVPKYDRAREAALAHVQDLANRARDEGDPNLMSAVLAVGGTAEEAGKKAIAKAYVAGIGPKSATGPARIERATRYFNPPLLLKGVASKD